MSKIGGKIIDGLCDALQYAEGETTSNKEHRVLIPERVDVRDVRQRLNSPKTVQGCSEPLRPPGARPNGPKMGQH